MNPSQHQQTFVATTHSTHSYRILTLRTMVTRIFLIVSLFCSGSLLLHVQTVQAFTPFQIAPHRPLVSCSSSNEGSSSSDSAPATSSSEQPNIKPDAPVTAPDILVPFPAAADPRYMCEGPVGQGKFVVSRTGGPLVEELANENLLRILKMGCSDLEANTLIWKCLGYRFDESTREWTAAEVFPKWKERFPAPPDLIGMQREYSKEIDQVVLKANQHLVRSVPVDNKQSLKVHLKPLGFTGYQVCTATVICKYRPTDCRL
jgi:hypothetical protein